jgi:broad specificity polyphosphatase/5'/3'-nucleotidase SurE
VDWDRATREAAAVLAALLVGSESSPPPRAKDQSLLDAACQAIAEAAAEGPFPPGFWSVNLPAAPDGQPARGVRLTRVSTDSLPTDYEHLTEPDGAHRFRYVGRYLDRTVSPGTDVAAVFDHCISISRIPL